MTPVFPPTESRPGRDDDLLSLYLSGKLDLASARRVELWMQSHPQSREAVEQFVSGAVMMNLQPPDATRVLRALESRIGADEGDELAIAPSVRNRDGDAASTTAQALQFEEQSEPSLTSAGLRKGDVAGHTPTRIFERLRWTAVHRQRWIAVGVAGLLVAAVFQGWMSSIRAHRAAAMASMSTYTTPNGQLSSLTLPDGSTVVLNVSSRLEVPTTYNDRDRTVRLQGEAYFDVVADSKRPFIVVTPRSATRVLGTTFVVREYQTDTVTVVAVKTGEVAVQKVLVSSQQQVTINQDGMARLAPAPRDFTTFTSGVLSLQKVPLSEAIVDLGRWYNVEIRINDAVLKTQEVTGKFAMGSLNDLVAILQMTFDIRVVREGRVLTLYSK